MQETSLFIPLWWNVFESFEIHQLLPGVYLEFSSTSGSIFLLDTTDMTLVFITLQGLLLSLIYMKFVFPSLRLGMNELVLFPLENSKGMLTEEIFDIFVLPLTTLFIVVLWGNVYGLLPHSFSATGHIAATFTLSVMVFLGWMMLGLYKLGIDFFAIFIPHDTPNWLFPLMVLVETMSYFIRPFSLSIRLFANILAGHILLHIITDNRLAMRSGELLQNFFMSFFLPVSLTLLLTLILSAVYILESGVALLQAYIFYILSNIYLVDSIAAREIPRISLEREREHKDII